MNQSMTQSASALLKLHLELRATETALSVVRDAAESLLRGSDLIPQEDDCVEEVMLAIQEGCNNVVMHAYPDAKPGPLIVTIAVNPGEVYAEIEDGGVGFSLDNASPISLDSPAKKGAGYGVFLMRGLMDEVRAETRGARHVLILRKTLTGEKA